jgi:hypothetical protein
MRPLSSPGSQIAFLCVAALVISSAPLTARAQGAEILRGADLKLGERLLVEHKCAQCHVRRVGGDGSSIYRPKGRINSAARLRGMVEQCSLQLNLQLFPEEVDAIAAVLNRDHYKFK